MRSFYIIPFCCCLFFSLAGVCQTPKQDSLMKQVAAAKDDSTKASQLIALAMSYKRTDWKKHLLFGTQAYKLIKNTNQNVLKAKALKIIGNGYYDMNEHPDSAMVYYEKGLELAKNNGLIDYESVFYNSIGTVYYRIGANKKAFQYYQNAISIAEREGFDEQLCRYLNNMALILQDEEEFDTALSYFGDALVTAEKLENKRIISALLTNIGVTYNLMGEYDLALENHFKSLDVRRENNDKFGEALCICNIGATYRRKGLYEASLTYQRDGYKLAVEYDYPNGERVCLQGLGAVLFRMGKYEEAIKYAEKGMEISLKTANLKGQAEFKQLLALSQAEMGDYKSAYETQSEFAELSDSLFNSTKLKQINELEAKYQLRQRETENSLILEKQKLQQHVIQDKNILIIVILIIALLISLLAFSYYRSSKQKQKYNDILRKTVEERTRELKQSIEELQNSNKELERFAFIASHDLKEPLRNIISFNSLIQEKLKDQTNGEIKNYFSYINNSGKQMYSLIESTLEYSRLSKAKGVNKPIDVNRVVKQVRKNLDNLIKEKNARIEFDSLPVIHTNPNQLYLIFKNLIENGIIYNENESPQVTISYEGGHQHLFRITDNGIGIPEEYHTRVFQMFKRLQNKSTHQGPGLGLSIVKKILSRLDGSISIDSTQGEGTTFIISIPVRDKKVIETPELTT